MFILPETWFWVFVTDFPSSTQEASRAPAGDSQQMSEDLSFFFFFLLLEPFSIGNYLGNTWS